jgi:hypothetical protein
MYKDRQNYDDMAWDKSDAAEEAHGKLIRLVSTCDPIEALATIKCGKPATMVGIIRGGYNVHYRLRLEGESPASDILVRVPRPMAAVFPDEKVLYEAAIAEFVRLKTRIPVAQVLHFERDSNIGPFLIIRRVENRGCFVQTLINFDPDIKPMPCLNLKLPEHKLRSLWGTLAWCLIELAKPTFPRIGSLLKVDASFQVAGRPLTLNMTNMRHLANIPTAIFPAENKTFATADEWYLELANMHLSQLAFQHNDLVSSEDDCRNKYVTRQLFRRLAKRGCLSTFGFAEDNWSADAKTSARRRFPAPDGSGSFRLWCDDFRPASLLLDPAEDDDKLAAAIDWEFAYVAPTQFVLDPPWWLLFETPEMWEPTGLDEWSKVYEPQLKIWLAAMEDQEQKEGAQAAFLDGRPLSAHMRESWETGRFWLNYAAKKSWAFDAAYWTYLDERFFGPRDPEVADNDLWRTRLDLLTQEEQQAMEPFVKQKMDESRERILVEWEPDEARKRLSELLFD